LKSSSGTTSVVSNAAFTPEPMFYPTITTLFLPHYYPWPIPVFNFKTHAFHALIQTQNRLQHGTKVETKLLFGNKVTHAAICSV
jgi:hypothetical protein